VLDHLAKNQLHWLFSQRRIAVEITDELPAQCPWAPRGEETALLSCWIATIVVIAYATSILANIS
jgi:hypothetical protein